VGQTAAWKWIGESIRPRSLKGPPARRKFDGKFQDFALIHFSLLDVGKADIDDR